MAVAKGNVQMLALSALASGDQTRHDGIACIETGGKISDSDANFDGRSVPFSRDVHESHLSFHHNIVSGAFGVWACLAVAGD